VGLLKLVALLAKQVAKPIAMLTVFLQELVQQALALVLLLMAEQKENHY
jgi:hypothetical protein